MKIILLILIPCFSIAQNRTDTIYPSTSYVGLIKRAIVKYPQDDTVKVIMLICDTSRLRNPVYMNSGVIDLYGTWYDHFTYWQYGYRVTSYTSSPYYLDERKKRLSKNIIVWDDR